MNMFSLLNIAASVSNEIPRCKPRATMDTFFAFFDIHSGAGPGVGTRNSDWVTDAVSTNTYDDG